jgi:hypothetical protein
MWSKLAEIMQDPSYKRLVLALCISILLHILLFDRFYLTLPSFKKETHLIEASIQMPKAEVKQVESSKPEEVIAQKSAAAKPAKPIAKYKVKKDIETDEVVAAVAAPVIAPDITIPDAFHPQSQAENGEPELPQADSQPVDAGLVINENAYQYVETNFDVRTKIDGLTEGQATIIYNLTDGSHYYLKWLTQGSGFAALLFPDLLQISEGVLNKTGLQPNNYSYHFGNKEDKTRIVNFDWQTRKVLQQTSKATLNDDLPEGTQDLLSFMYQFMYVEPLQKMQIHIATGKKLATYDYSFEGEENLNVPLGELKTIHIIHSGRDDEGRTEVWLAMDYQYIPVKIRKIENNGKVVEMVATRINTNRPTINN